jgi:hypothetical protein
MDFVIENMMMQRPVEHGFELESLMIILFWVIFHSRKFVH